MRKYPAYRNPIKAKLINPWRAMMKRCYDESHDNHHRYKHVGVCDRWHDFNAFVEDMSASYKPGLWLDRIENSKGYSPDNCRWVTPKESQRNKTNNVNLTVHGETKPVSAWAEDLGVHRNVILDRLKMGWSHEDAATKPPQRNMLTVNGVRKRLADWSRLYRIDRRVIQARLRRGWDEQRAVVTPLQSQGRKQP